MMWLVWAGGAVGAAIAVGTVGMHVYDPARIDTELRDFGVLIGFEIAALSFALASLIKTMAKTEKDRPEAPFVI